MSKSNDVTIKALMAKIEEKRATLGVKPKVAWKTNALFKYDDNKHFNLNAINDIPILVDALGFVYAQISGWQKACDTLGVKSSSAIEWKGFALADWEADFKARVAAIVWEEERNKLRALEVKLKALVSEEARTEMELEDISKLLG
jgi:hypothetical protein